MKVLVVFNHPAPYKVNVFNALSEYCDLTVLFERTKAKNRPVGFYHDLNCKFNVIYNKKGYFSDENTYSLETKRYIKKHHKEFDLIVMNGYSTISEMIAINYLIRHHIKYALLVNGGIIRQKESFIRRIIKKHYIKHASYYMSPSIKTNEYLKFYGAKDEVIFNYPYSTLKDENIINKPLSKSEKKAGKKEYGLPTNDVYICPGQFIKRKNNLELISLFKDINATLLLVGEGEEKNNYLKYIKDNNINNVVIKSFMPKNDLLNLMKYCDGVISLSHHDIYGHTLLEGMSQGIIPITSKNVISAHEIIKNHENGIILKFNADLKKEIESITPDMNKKALMTAKEYTIEKSAYRFNEIFKEIIK